MGYFYIFNTGIFNWLFVVQAHKVAVTSLALCLRDKTIASGSSDGKLILYSAVTKQGCSPLHTSSNQVQSVFYLMSITPPVGLVV